MIIGFTGTRWGMSPAQKAALTGLLKSFQRNSLAFECHHGDCIGADSEFADIAAEVYRCMVSIVCHPPTDTTYRAFNTKVNETLPPLIYFARNRAIVDVSQVVIGCPREMSHQTRGGTWYTLDYAKRKGKPTIIIWPDGKIASQEST